MDNGDAEEDTSGDGVVGGKSGAEEAALVLGSLGEGGRGGVEGAAGLGGSVG